VRLLSRLPLRDLSDDLVDHLGRDLVHAVLLARVYDDLPEISSSDSPWKVAQHPGTSTPHLNSFTSNLLSWPGG